MSIQAAPLSQLADQCHQEQTDAKDGRACFELLRRALDQQDGVAWHHFEQQFRPLFYYWIHRDAAYYGMATPPDDLLDEIWVDSFSRFAERYAVDAQLTHNFSHIGAVLKVLQKCIRTTMQLQQREQQRRIRLYEALAEADLPIAARQKNPADQVELDTLRRCIQEGLATDVPEPELSLLLELRFGLDLKPRVIAEQYPEHFPTVKDVHQQYDRLLKRLKRRLDIYVERCL